MFNSDHDVMDAPDDVAFDRFDIDAWADEQDYCDEIPYGDDPDPIEDMLEEFSFEDLA